MKKTLLSLISTLLCGLTIGLWSACDWVSTSTPHTHAFSETVATETYLKSEATCMKKAVYYRSCSCGEKGTETFDYGELGEHNYGDWESNDNGTHTKTCANDSSHTITENCSGGTATCVSLAVCEDCETEYGTYGEHACSETVATETYLKSEATCMKKAVYYKSCSCGEKGTETFDYGELGEHNYGDWESNDNGTHTKTCANDSSHTITENCSGGTATCVSLAVCEDCETEYGTYGEHAFSNAWTIENGKHWHICQNTGCQEISEENGHIYTNGVCVCGDEEVVVDIHIISQTQWESAFDFENVTIKQYVVIEEQNIPVGNYLLDGNDVLFVTDSIQYTMTGYANLVRALFNFSDCYDIAEYQNGQYYISSFDVYGDASYVYENAYLTFENGVLLSISATIKEEVPEYDDDYNEIGTTIETSVGYFEFVDYGTTNTTLENTLPITQEEWEEVFAAENCNNMTIVVTFYLEGIPVTENWYIDNGKEKITVSGNNNKALYCLDSTWYTYYVNSGDFVQTDLFGSEFPYVKFSDLYKDHFSTMKDMYSFISYDENEEVYYFNIDENSVYFTIEDGKITSLTDISVIEGQTSVFYYSISNYGTTSFTVPFDPTQV